MNSFNYNIDNFLYCLNSNRKYYHSINNYIIAFYLYIKNKLRKV